MAFTPGMERSVQVQVDSSGVEGFTGAMGRARGMVAGFGAAIGAAGAALSALAVGGMAKAINAAREFETAMVEVERVSNSEVADELRGEILALSEEIPLAQEELAGLAADAARFGIEGSASVREFTETVARMATATDLAANEAGEALAKLTELTNTPIEQVENLGSAINSLGNNFATSQSEIVDAMLRSSAALSQLGLRQTEIAGLSAAINEVSESSRRAGTRLRRLAQELLNPDKVRAVSDAVLDSSESFGALTERGRDLRMQFADQNAELTRYQDQLRSTSDELQGLSDAHEELGDSVRDNRIKIKQIRLEARKEGRDLTEEEKQQLEELRTENEELRLEQLKNRDAQEELKDEREAQKEQVEQQQAAVEETREAFAAEFETVRDESPLELIRAIAASMGEGGEQADAFRQELSSASRQAAAGLAQNLEGVDSALSTSQSSFEEATSLQREFTKVQQSTDGQLQLLRNRIRNVAIQTGDALLPAFNRLLDGTVELLSPLAALVERTDGVAGAAGLALLAVGGLAALVAGFVSGPLALLIAAVGTLGTVFATNFGGIRDIVTEAFAPLSDEFDELLDTLGDLRDVIVGGLSGAFESEGEETLSAVQDAVSGILGVFTAGLEFLLNAVVLPLLNSLVRLYRAHFEDLVTETLRTVRVILEAVNGFVATVMPLWELFGDEILATVRTAFDVLRVIFVTGLDAIISTVRIFLALLRGDFSGAFEILAGLGERFIDRLLRLFRTAPLLAPISAFVDDAVQAFRELDDRARAEVEALIDSLTGYRDDIVAAFTGIAEQIGTAIRTAINDALGLPFERTIGSVDVQGEQVFGGETIRIPALAEGGIVTDPSLVMAGEAGAEAVVPLDRLGELGAADGAASGRVTVDVSLPEGGGAFERALRELVSVEVEGQLTQLNRQLERRQQRSKL
jgi:TP901 family phage tail tape measure protein